MTTKEQLRIQVLNGVLEGKVRVVIAAMGNEANSPNYIFNEPRVGYRMPEGETQGSEEA